MFLHTHFKCVYSSSFLQTIAKVLLQYSAILTKSFPSYIDKEKIVSFQHFITGYHFMTHIVYFNFLFFFLFLADPPVDPS